MPPKSSKSKILGRFSSHLKIGIVGLPNVSKSTLFNTLTKLSIPAENFFFAPLNLMKPESMSPMTDLNGFATYTNQKARFQHSWKSMTLLDWFEGLMKDKAWAIVSYHTFVPLLAFFMFYYIRCPQQLSL